MHGSMLPLSDVEDALIGYFLESYFKWFSTTVFVKNTVVFGLLQVVAIINTVQKVTHRLKWFIEEACKWRMTRY